MLLEIRGRGEMPDLALFLICKQFATHKIKKISSRRLIDHVVASPMRLDRIAVSRVAKGMTDQFTLAVIQQPHPLQFRLDRPKLPRASLHVFLQGTDRTPQYFGVINKQIY